MAHAKALGKVTISNPLPIYGGGTLPAGSEITLSDEWETIPYAAQARIIIDHRGDRRLVIEQDLDHALGAS